ncbi:hypothetical protein [Blattabacterium sp. (Cryptocercus kyebangensis)]|uniref:hypothetical protein n=1 Tax=Blattabacterium sp. (Cryptocercus kyebangensis) TaxID=298656 RepID=UPI003977C4F9
MTGSGKGIGYEIVKKFLNMGDHVLSISYIYKNISQLSKLLNNRKFGICIPL